MESWQQGDETPVTADEIDWSLFDPGRVDHVRTKLLGFALETGQCTKGLVAGALVTFHDRSKMSGRRRGGRSTPPVDMTSAIEAKGRLAGAEGALADARGHFKDTVRQVYRDGATAPNLAKALGLSVGRVNQLVAGGRG